MLVRTVLFIGSPAFCSCDQPAACHGPKPVRIFSDQQPDPQRRTDQCSDRRGRAGRNDPCARFRRRRSPRIPASRRDQQFRAFDGRTGRTLWRTTLPAGGNATPLTYLGRDGRQYVVIAAGGHGGLRSRNGDSVVAFALDKRP